MTQAGIQTIGRKEPSKINSEYLSRAWESMYTLLFYALIKLSIQVSTLEPVAHWAQFLPFCLRHQHAKQYFHVPHVQETEKAKNPCAKINMTSCRIVSTKVNSEFHTSIGFIFCTNK